MFKTRIELQKSTKFGAVMKAPCMLPLRLNKPEELRENNKIDYIFRLDQSARFSNNGKFQGPNYSLEPKASCLLYTVLSDSDEGLLTRRRDVESRVFLILARVVNYLV